MSEPDTKDVLVLNAAYQPIAITGWKEAFVKMYSEKAEDRVEIVCTYKDRYVNSATQAHPMPCVVRHLKFRAPKKTGIKFSRDNVWARDKGRCQYCGIQVPRNTYTYDHVHPKSRGGKTTWENIVVACADCNGKKRDRTPQEARMKLLSIPRKPEMSAEFRNNELKFRKWMPEEWKVFLGDYWHGDSIQG